MLINLQVPEISELLWSLFRELDESKQAEYAERVDAASSLLFHPDLGGAVLCTVRGYGAPQAARAL